MAKIKRDWKRPSNRLRHAANEEFPGSGVFDQYRSRSEADYPDRLKPETPVETRLETSE